MDIDIEIDMKDALRSFEMLLNERERKNTMRAVKLAGASVVRKAAKKTASRYFKDQTGKLRASVGTAKTGIYKTRNGGVFVLAGGSNAPHAHLVEFGHNSRRNGPVEGNPWMAETAEDNADEAIKAAHNKFISFIDKKLTKKGLK